jgi:hypothetical protein
VSLGRLSDHANVNQLPQNQLAQKPFYDGKQQTDGSETMHFSRWFFLAIGILSFTPTAQALGFDTLYNRMEARLCKERLAPFFRFVWENREKRNMRVLLAKCTATTALKRGYVINPTRVFNDASPAGAQSVAADVCTCTVGDWAASVCEPLRQPLPF